MGCKITVKADINFKNVLNTVRSDKLWKASAQEWHRLITPFTPMESGLLSEQVIIRPKEVEYTAPYAHYVYEGKAMGDTFPILQNGVIVGFFSPKGKRKHYTGGKLNIKKDKHPKASIRWDRVAQKTEKRKLVRFIQKLLDSGRF